MLSYQAQIEKKLTQATFNNSKYNYQQIEKFEKTLEEIAKNDAQNRENDYDTINAAQIASNKERIKAFLESQKKKQEENSNNTTIKASGSLEGLLPSTSSGANGSNTKNQDHNQKQPKTPKNPNKTSF